ncbi:hypothetical protein BDB01DRAFT_790899 [Pilobolus umbonatus]|nr:hypothetical protein BDB01DRAFT_790899 [Pilobolus umbonatus]
MSAQPVQEVITDENNFRNAPQLEVGGNIRVGTGVDPNDITSTGGLLFLLGFCCFPLWCVGSCYPKEKSRFKKLNRIMAIMMAVLLIVLIVLFVVLLSIR